MSPEPIPPRRGLLLLLLAFTLIWFSNLEYRKLVRPDEGRYAEIPREMVATGNWITPRLDGIKYFEKPPLQYWATAAAYEIFGEHQWTARLWSALTGFAGILLAYFVGTRLFGQEAGLYSALVLGSSLLYVAIGHINTLDMGVSFFLELALAGFLLAQRPEASPGEVRGWMLTAWAAAALSVLSKGLIGVALPGAALVLYSLLNQDFSPWKRLHLASGFVLFLAIAAPWFIAVMAKNPEFFHFFFIHEHFERFLTKEHGRYHPWWYFVPIFLLGILPWIATVIDALPRAWRREGEGAFSPSRFLLVWAVFIYLFFSVSDSKLPSYILPIFPALALLMGRRLAAIRGRALAWHFLPMAPVGAAGLVLAPQVVKFASDEVPARLYAGYIPWLYAAALALLAGTAYGLYQSARNRTRPALIGFALCSLISGQLVLTGHNSLAPASSAYAIAQEIKPFLKPGVPFYSVGMYEQTLPFYIKRTVTLVAFRGELDFGLQQEPALALPDLESFEQAWRRQPYALAIMDPGTYSKLVRKGLPMQMIARDTRRVAVKTPWDTK